MLLTAALRDDRRTAGTWTSPSDCSQCVPSCMSTPCPGQLHSHYLHTIYTLYLPTICTISKHHLHTIYSLSTHYLPSIYTISTQYLYTNYLQASVLQHPVPAAGQPGEPLHDGAVVPRHPHLQGRLQDKVSTVQYSTGQYSTVQTFEHVR